MTRVFLGYKKLRNERGEFTGKVDTVEDRQYAIMASLFDGNKTAVEIAAEMGIRPSLIRPTIQQLARDGYCARVGTKHTKAVYAVRRSASAAEPRADADGGGDSPVLCGGISGMSRYLLQGGRP